MLVKMHELVPSGDRMDTPSPGPRRLKKAASRSTLSPWERADLLCDARHRVLCGALVFLPNITCFTGRLHRSENQHNISAPTDLGSKLEKRKSNSILSPVFQFRISSFEF